METSPQTRRRPRPLILWSALGLGLLVVAGGIVFALRTAQGDGPSSKAKGNSKKNNKDAPIAAPVELSCCAKGDIATYLETTTTLEPENQATLVAKRQGQVVAVLAEEGQSVSQGQILARIDPTEAKLALDKATISSDVAKRELERGKQLKEKAMISDKELDDLDMRERVAWQELEQARYDLSQTNITAPFGGRVLERMVHLGETVTPGNDCYRIADMTPLRARVYFPERELSRVRVGQTAVLQSDTRPGAKYNARVAIVNPAVDLSNGTFKVTLEVSDKSGDLRPGTFCRVQLLTGTFHDAICVPRRALLSEDGDDFVFLARADSVNRVKVNVGAVSGDTVQILAGITPGDSVVTVGQGGLKQGSKIRPVRS